MSKYVIDEMGNRYEGMSKDEILEAIGMKDLTVTVFTDKVTYQGEEISYNYTGNKPADNYLIKLLDVSLDFTKNLAPSEVSILLDLGEFKLHFFLCETEVYITNGHCDVINIFNINLGVRNLYVNSSKVSYYIKSNSKMNDVYFCSKLEYEKIAKDPNVTYVVEDENYLEEQMVGVIRYIEKNTFQGLSIDNMGGDFTAIRKLSSPLDEGLYEIVVKFLEPEGMANKSYAFKGYISNSATQILPAILECAYKSRLFYDIENNVFVEYEYYLEIYKDDSSDLVYARILQKRIENDPNETAPLISTGIYFSALSGTIEKCYKIERGDN